MPDNKPKMTKRNPGGKRTTPKRTAPKTGETRTRMLMSNPPIRVRERKVNGRWVEISRQKMPKSSGTRKPVGYKPKLADKKPTTGEPPNRRMTVARRRSVEQAKNKMGSKKFDSMQKNIKKMQRKRPY